MLTKADIKFVKALGDKNFRRENKLFVAEGHKSVDDLLASGLKPNKIYALESWLNANGSEVTKLPVCPVKQKDLEQMSSLKSNRDVIAVFEIPQNQILHKKPEGLVLALDSVQDPGNLGTLIRLADWYGVKNILCSEQTVDCFNNKVVQSTMGSLGRVQVHYGNLATWFDQFQMPVIAASMEGKPGRQFIYPENMILLLGSEGSGIQPQLKVKISETIAIEKTGKAESLNVAMAGAILLDRYFGQVHATWHST